MKEENKGEKNTDKKLHPKETNTTDKLRKTNKAIKRIQMSNCRMNQQLSGPGHSSRIAWGFCE